MSIVARVHECRRWRVLVRRHDDGQSLPCLEDEPSLCALAVAREAGYDAVRVRCWGAAGGVGACYEGRVLSAARLRRVTRERASLELREPRRHAHTAPVLSYELMTPAEFKRAMRVAW